MATATPEPSVARRRLAGLAVGIALVTTLPRLTSLGMFVDGVYYAAVARNLARGLGTPWTLLFTPGERFLDHPPGGIWLLVPAFALFGDSPRVEALVSGAAGLALLALVVGLWRSLEVSRAAGSWLALLILVALPITSWVFASNLLDLYLTLFTTAAVWVALVGSRAASAKRALALGALGGLLVTYGFLVKGPTALFPLATPLWAGLLLPGARRRSAALVAAGMLSVTALGALGLVAWAPARGYLGPYFQRQVVGNLRWERASSHVKVLRVLAKELAVPALVIVLWRAWLARRRLAGRVPREAVVLALVGASASLPVVLSAKQDLRYVFQALPIFALSLAALVVPGAALVERAVTRARSRWLLALSTALAAGAVLAAVLEGSEIRKMSAFHEDFTRQPVSLPAWSTVATCPPRISTFALRSNFSRHLLAAVDRPGRADFFLTLAEDGCSPPPGCRWMHPPTPRRFALYDCRPATAGAGTTLNPAAPAPDRGP